MALLAGNYLLLIAAFKILFTYIQVPIECELLGSFFRQSKGRVMTLSVDESGKYLACHVCLRIFLIVRFILH